MLSKQRNIDMGRSFKLEADFEFDNEGKRILTDWHSADDWIYMQKVIRERFYQGDENIKCLPFQLFIDKANVTRLNKRSMYPIVLYLCCFDRSIRRRLAVVVAFVPIISDTSKHGRKISDEKVRMARRTVFQAKLQKLLYRYIGLDIQYKLENLYQ